MSERADNGKIKQFTYAYKEVKDNNGLAGRRKKTFEFYEQIDQAMGDGPISKPPCVSIQVIPLCLSQSMTLKIS